MAQYGGGGYNPYGNQPPGPNAAYGQPGQGAMYGGASPAVGNDGFASAGQYQDPSQQQYAGAGQQPGSAPGPDQVGALAENMAGMQVGGRKKKNRHAYHDLGQPAPAVQQFNGMPPGPAVGGQQPQFGGQAGQTGQSPYGLQQQQQPQQPGPGAPQFSQQGGSFVQGARTGTAPPSNEVQGTGVSTQGRVDPDQIPSVPRARDSAEAWYQEHTYLTMEQHLPPPAAISYVAYDQGNSSPKYAQLTLNDIPTSAEALASTSLPLGIVLQPLAPLSLGEQPIPVLDFGETGPPRCRRCRTYINPFMTFKNGGNKFVCNMCTFPNDVPAEYFAPTDLSGVRVDREQRPELKLGTVEYMVPKEYWAKPPVPLRQLFVIDVSMDAINRGSTEVFCRGVLAALYGDDVEGEDPPPEERALAPGCKVGFVTFDRDVHFYNCSAKLSQAQMLVMPDIEDPFLPLGTDGLFVDPYEAKANVSGLLAQLPQLFSNVKNPEPALLPVLTSCMDALSTTGGKILCSVAALPTFGPGKLFMRDDKNLHGVETERKLFQTENQNWKKCAAKMVESGIGVDYFVTAA